MFEQNVTVLLVALIKNHAAAGVGGLGLREI
jgi:hypothetical protein